MLFNDLPQAADVTRQNIRDFYRADENKVLDYLLPLAETGVKVRTKTWERARKLILKIRQVQSGKGGVDALLQEFAISSDEGVVLMCLAEALLRVPDKTTADELIRDKLSGGDWISHIGQSDSMFVNASSWGLLLTGKLVNYRNENQKDQYGIMKKMIGRMGEPLIRKAVRQSMELMGSQFVMGVTIDKALKRAVPMESKGYTYSYDMLGEGARTMEDADRYMESYINAIESIGIAAKGKGPIMSPGISIKLSAIHPRYEFSHKERVMDELVPRLKKLAVLAKQYDIGLTVDAEEADRLDISLDVIEAVFCDSSLQGWDGFGMAVQAYQRRAIYVIEWIRELTEKANRKMMVRLVKGAYWDSEIKISQTEGFDDFPVFTRKASTDVCYQACAKKLLSYRDTIYPQFASHNAYTVSTILEMNAETRHFSEAQNQHTGFEFQRLHGMGESLFDQVVNQEKVACRVYAPVGAHVDLLAYLVRRLLENGANSSFVNNIVDESISVESLLADPLETVSQWKEKRNTQIATPRGLYQRSQIQMSHNQSGSSQYRMNQDSLNQDSLSQYDLSPASRVNSKGLDLTDLNRVMPLKLNLDDWVSSRSLVQPLKSEAEIFEVTNPADNSEILAYLEKDNAESMKDKLQASHIAFENWSKKSVEERSQILLKMADALEIHMDELMAICMKEAGKTAQDSVSEVREAVDFCRYYGLNAPSLFAENKLQSLGVVLCISPWNFPLAIFLGQVSAALVCGNCVIAKPAEQTSLIAIRAIEIMLQCGLPENVVNIVKARGSLVGKIIVPDERIKAVMFTGSTEVGSWMAKTLSERGGEPIPLIAETGGQNCMIVDSTALPEQVVDDVIASGFQSAGQRCSALRVLFLQDGIADKVINMIRGAMDELKVGDPAYLSTDVGPVIDTKALASLQQHADQMKSKGELLHICRLDKSFEDKGTFFAPRLYEISDLSILEREVFGPCVHVIRFEAGKLENVMQQIANTRFGLTMGIHSRIGEKCAYLAERSVAGNVYVNRNMIGAVVGVQPFGGRGLSGTGPKAGGPHYLSRLVKVVSACDGDKLPEQKSLELDEICQSSNSVDMETLAQGFKQWRYQSIESRVSIMRQLLAHISADEEISGSISELDDSLESCRQTLLKIENSWAQPVQLPGPTGESNWLYFEPRGIVLNVFESMEKFDSWLGKIIIALAAGNSVVTIVASQDKASLIIGQKINNFLESITETKEIYQTEALECLPVLLQEQELSGALICSNSEWLTFINQKLAAREGEILPVIAGDDSRTTFYRLVTEKTISIDTTAAGGNASLMTMAEEGIAG